MFKRIKEKMFPNKKIPRESVVDDKGTTVIEWERMLVRVVVGGALTKERNGEPLTEAQVMALKKYRGEG